MALLVSKVPFWEGASKGGFTICDTQKLCSAENAIFIVFSAKHSFAEIKECMLKKQKFTKNRGLFANMQKGVFCLFFCGFAFFMFLFFFVWKKAPQRQFLVVSEFFSFCVPKKPVFEIFLFFLFCFVSLFSFCPPFQNSIVFLWFLSISPFWKIFYFWFLLFLLPLPLFMFACFFQTNFPTILFQNPSCLHVWPFLCFFCYFCFRFRVLCFCLFCFYGGFVFWYV